MSQYGEPRRGQNAQPLRVRSLLWEVQAAQDALWGAYDGDPVDFLAEGGDHPDLEAWCHREGLDAQRIAALMVRELAPLHPGIIGEQAAATPGRLTELGRALAGSCSACLELLGPHIAIQLVRGLAVPERDEAPWPEQQLVALGERHSGVAALLRGYDEAMKGQPSRAENHEQSLWQRLRRHLLALRARRFMGLQVQRLLSLSLQVEASQHDPALLRELGQLVLDRGEVVKNGKELQDLLAIAREALGREAVEPREQSIQGWRATLVEVERQAQRMDRAVRPFGRRAVVIIEDRLPDDRDRSVRLHFETPPEAYEAVSGALVRSPLPVACQGCHTLPALRELIEVCSAPALRGGPFFPVPAGHKPAPP